MEEVCVSIATKLAEYLVGPAIREGRYLFCVGKVKRNVLIEKENLAETQGRVQRRIDEALIKTEKIDEAVDDWNKEVKKIMEEVDILLQQLNGYFRRWCPTRKRYRLCKLLAKKTERMQQLNKESKFEPFSHPTPLAEIDEDYTSGDFVYFNSTKEVEKKLLVALRDDDNGYIIGLYGMGGSGKTSLSIHVGKKAKEMRMFDHVIITTVSQEPQIRKIQDEIADRMGFKYEENSDSGRATRLSMRLKSGERILIILDDVWEKLDFKQIGIPIEGNHHKGCKVLLTTRLQQVCTLMGCDTNTMIPLHLLSEEESWSLFKRHAGINNGTSEVAREIVKECKGLPIAIVAVGTSLKGKPDYEWKVALHRLKHSKPLEVEPGVRDAFTCLKLSYNYLRNEAAKSILLMCSMFPEDHEIELEDLFKYGIGLGIFEKVDSFEIARYEVNSAIRILIESGLLNYSGEENKKKHLKMHDLVRDVALWIASKEKGDILINEGTKLDELRKGETVKDCFIASSWDMRIDHGFPCELNASKLEVLLWKLPYYDEKREWDWSNLSFEGVKQLKVVAVIGMMISPLSLLNPPKLSLPQSTQWLSNLRTLRLVGMELGDISFVLSLKRLEILDLSWSRIKELPSKFDELNKLRLLDLSMCAIKKCFDEVIKRFSHLEELYVYGDGMEETSIKSYETLENLVKLQNYVISVGKWPREISNLLQIKYSNFPMKVVCMAKLNISTLGKGVKNLLQRANKVQLKSLTGGCKSIIPEMVQAVGGMKHLTVLALHNCDEIECLVHKTSAHEVGSFLKKLETLHIYECPNLQSTFPSGINLCSLKRLTITECPLTSLFPMSVAQNLLKLEKMILSNCGLLKYIIGNEETGVNTEQDNSCLADQIQNPFPLLKTLYLYDLPCLLKILQENHNRSRPSMEKQQWKLSTNMVDGRRLSDDAPPPTLEISVLGIPLQNLETLVLYNCGKVKYIFSMDDLLYKILPCLTSLEISLCEELEEIIYENEEPQNISNAQVCFPNLKKIKIWRCNKLKTLFSSTMDRILPHLLSLEIEDCDQLKEVFTNKVEDNKDKIVLPNLRNIRLYNLPLLIDFCRGMKIQGTMLSDFQISGCPNFALVSEYFKMALELEGYGGQVSNQDMSMISSARSLTLVELNELIFLWKGPTLISFKSLESLRLFGCKKLKFIFSDNVIRSLPQLQQLIVEECEELEEIISYEEEEEEDKDRRPLNSHPCFPKLSYISIKGNKRLKCVFPMSFMVGDLPSLQQMNIKSCSQLEYVFGSVYSKSTMEIEFVLPNLERLELNSLPILIDFCVPQYQLPALQSKYLCIINCPKLSPATLMVLGKQP